MPLELEATYENGILKPDGPLPFEEHERLVVTVTPKVNGMSDGADVASGHHNGNGSRVRGELARDLILRVDQLIPMVGDVSLATHLQLLKRDLSRCHDALGGHFAEGAFLSIVTLVESAMAQLKWRQYDRTRLDAIRQVLDTGYRQATVGFADYERARVLLAERQVETTPRIDLASLNRDDLTDEEEQTTAAEG